MAETALAQPESRRDSSRHVRSQSAAYVWPKLRPKLPPSTLGASLERTKAAKAAAAKVAAAKVAVAMHARALVSLSPPATLPPPPVPPLAPSSSAIVRAAKLAWPKNQSEYYYNNHNGAMDSGRPCAYTEQRDCHNGNSHNTEDAGMAATSTDEQPSATEVQARPLWRTAPLLSYNQAQNRAHPPNLNPTL